MQAHRHVIDGETGLVVGGNDAASWAAALRRVITDEPLRARLGHAAAEWAAHSIPSWRDVLNQDLLSVWHRARAA